MLQEILGYVMPYDVEDDWIVNKSDNKVSIQSQLFSYDKIHATNDRVDDKDDDKDNKR